MQIDENTRVLVTGGAGVIGRELLELIAQQGAQILCIDRQPLPAGFTCPGLTHIEQDLSVGGIAEARCFEPNLVFHLAAAFERSRESPEFWDANWRDNVLVSHRLADGLARASSVQAVVFASSYLIYDPALYLSATRREQPVRLRESDPVSPRNVCGAAKFYAERELDFLRKVRGNGLRTVHARIFRVYGRGSRDIISRFIRAALHGQNLDLYNQENRFDFIFARDVAEGLVRLAQAEAARGVVNLGTGVAHSIQQVVQTLQRLLPSSWVHSHDEGVVEDYEASAADITRLGQVCGYQPATTLEQGITAIVTYEQQRKAEGARTLPGSGGIP